MHALCPITFKPKSKFGRDNFATFRAAAYGEPADIIDRWASEHNLNKTIRDAVIRSLCQRDTIHCSREIPRVFSITVSDLSDKLLEILEGEEAADAILKYIRKAGAPLHRRIQIFNIACARPRVLCTRRRGLYYKANIHGINETFAMWEDDLEPMDALYKFGKRHNLSWMARDRIFRSIVGVTKSTRQEVMIASFDVNNESTRYCHRILKIPFRDYEVFVGSIFATTLLAPVWGMRLALGPYSISSACVFSVYAKHCGTKCNGTRSTF